MTDEVADRARRVLAEVLGIVSSDIHDESSPDTIKSWDSLKHMTLILALEDEFEISFSDDDVVEMLNFRLIRVILSERITANSGVATSTGL